MAETNGPQGFADKFIYLFRYGNWTGGGYAAGRHSDDRDREKESKALRG